MKILIVLASGIGNSILFGPTLRELKKNYPSAKIDIFAYKKDFAEPFTESKLINKAYFYKNINSIFDLRKNNYDISITSFPSNKWQFNLFAFLVGAKRRITHSYNIGKISTLSFLQNNKIKANEKIHDVDQNLNLLKFLDIKLPKNKFLFFETSKKNRNWANEFISNNKLKNKNLIGIHPGSGPYTFKRVDQNKFIEQINKIKSKNKLTLIFGGPDEEGIKKELKEKLGNNALIVNSSLKNTASLIKKCKYFISNDTGLMHIAVAMKVPNITAFFNGTNPIRTRPYDKNAEVIILKENELMYPFWRVKG